jgi:ketosteroid isomerase-like protein
MSDRPEEVVRRFTAACRAGDVAALRSLLHRDAVAVVDTGGPGPTTTGPVSGEDLVELLAVLLGGGPGAELTVEAVNGGTGLALRRAGRAVAVVGLTVADGGIAVLWAVLNPVKLLGWHHR